MALEHTKFIGKMLLERGLLTEKQLAHAIDMQQQSGKALGRLLVELGYVKEDDIFTLLGKKFGTTYIKDLGEKRNWDKDRVIAMVKWKAEQENLEPNHWKVAQIFLGEKDEDSETVFNGICEEYIEAELEKEQGQAERNLKQAQEIFE